MFLSSGLCIRSRPVADLFATLKLRSVATNVQYTRLRSDYKCDMMDSSLRSVIASPMDTPASSAHVERQLSPDCEDYNSAIRDLNSLQSNSQVIALAKYKQPQKIIPLFEKQLRLSGITVQDLNKLNIIHVSGTKGKGSTCAFLEKILTNTTKLKLKVGCYNSPHLVSVTERIRIDSKSIDKQLFAKHFRHVYDKLRRETLQNEITMPSYFSFLTILAFHIFLDEKVDCAVVEVGIGGEYDPTNIVDRPLACAITTLDLDHTNILGKTIERIAWTKAGIIKEGVPIFTTVHEQKEATEMIRKRALERSAPLFICDPIDQSSGIQLGIESAAQYVNASIACQLGLYALDRLTKSASGPIPRTFSHDPIILQTLPNELPEDVRASLKSCQLPGRCQMISCPGIVFFLDGAHTSKSMQNCIDWFNLTSRRINKGARKHVLVNVIGERDKVEVLRPLAKYPGFDTVIFSTNKIQPEIKDFVTSDNYGGQIHQNEKSVDNAYNNANIWNLLTQHELNPLKNAKVVVHSSTIESIRFLENNYPCPEDNSSQAADHVLVTGSLHFVGAMLETINVLYSK